MKKKIAIGFAVFVVLGVIGNLMKKDVPSVVPTDAAVVNETKAARSEPKSGVTKANFLRLTNGMSYEEVVAILGEPGEETVRMDVAGISGVSYMWKSRGILGGGGNMSAQFQNGKLIVKAQFGLR